MFVRNFVPWFVLLHRLLDVVIPIGVLNLIMQIYGVVWSDKYFILGLIASLSFLIMNQSLGIYNNWYGRTAYQSTKLILKSWVRAWVLIIIAAFFFKESHSFSRVTLAGWFVLTPFILILFRVFLRGIIHKVGRNTAKKCVAIIGCSHISQQLVEYISKSSFIHYKEIDIYDSNSDQSACSMVNFKGSIEDFIAAKSNYNQYDEVFVTLPFSENERIRTIFEKLTDSTAQVKFIPDFHSLNLLYSNITMLSGLPVINVYDSPLNRVSNAALKRIEDIVLSSLILLIASPVLIFVAIGVKLSSPGPIFYKQDRVGWNGKVFQILKFRSMPVQSETNNVEWGNAQQKQKTRFGAFIRRTSLDELPQFINVLKGDMSIVGPRPERDVFVEQFRNEIPRYMQKHLIKAGITGWAQINGWRGDTSLEKRVEYDLYYIDNWSIWLDLQIILSTPFKGMISQQAY